MSTLSTIPLPGQTSELQQPLQRARLAIALAALLLLAFHDALAWMAMRWMPMLGHTDLPWTQRLTAGEGYYHHGPAVLATSITLAILTARKHGLPTHRTTACTFGGSVLLALAVAMHLLGHAAGAQSICGFALIGILAALVLLSGGWPLWRTYAGPLLLLLFMVPLPVYLLTQLTYPLKQFAAQAAAWLVGAAGIDAQVLVNAVHFPGGAGATASLSIDDSCSGLRSLLTLMWLAGFFAVASRWRAWRAALLIAAALPIALACNALRIGALIAVAKSLGPDAVAPHTALHQWVGLLAFAGALGALLLITTRIRTSDKPASDQRPATAPRPRLPRFAWGALLLIAAASLTSIVTSDPAKPQGPTFHAEALPDTVTLTGQTYTAIDLPISDGLRTQLGNADVLHRRYINEQQTMSFDLVLVAHPTQPGAIHPPEVCLQALGAQTSRKDRAAITASDGRRIPTHRLTTVSHGLSCEHLYTYHTAHGWTDRYLHQRAAMTLASIMPGQNTASPHGAVARITVPDPHGRPQQSRRLAEQAAAALLPAVEHALPR